MKGGRNLDIFACRISYDFSLSETMWQRAIRSRSFGNLVIRDAAYYKYIYFYFEPVY